MYLCREAVCIIFMMVFGMTRPGCEHTTYRVRGGHANHYANTTRCSLVESYKRKKQGLLSHFQNHYRIIYC